MANPRNIADGSEYALHLLSFTFRIRTDGHGRRTDSPFWAGRTASLNQGQSKIYGHNTVVGASYSHASILQLVPLPNHRVWTNRSRYIVY